MKSDVSISGKDILITLAGSIDSLTAKDLKEAVGNVSFDNADSVTINIADVPYISSAGLREFLIMQKRFHGGRIKIKNAGSSVKEIFEVTGFADFFDILDESGRSEDYTVFSFKDFLANKVALFPDRLILDDGTNHWSFKDLDKASDLVAEDLLKLGAKKGSHIAICGGNSINWIATFFAIQKIGAMAVLVSPLLKAKEICFLSKVGDITIFCHGMGAWLMEDKEKFFEDLVDPDESEIRFLYDILLPIDINGREPEGLMKNVIESITVQKDDPCTMIFTSGSTGVPKGVLLSSFNLLMAATSGLDILNTDENDIFCMSLPLFHIFGMAACLLAAMINESKIVIPPRIKPDDMLTFIAKEGCTVLSTVPTLLLGMAANPDFSKDKVKTLAHILIGGAAISESQLLYLNSMFENTRFDIVYGLSEISPISYTKLGDDIKHVTRTVGRPSKYVTVRIQDPETLKECPVGISGEITVQGELLMSGYYKTPLEKQDFDEMGWFHTGDLGFLDEEGYLHFTGRKKDIIIRGGENIIPGEIAQEVTTYPNVVACQIVGLPDDYYGEVVGCALVNKEGTSFDEADFLNYLGERIARHKLPSHVFVYKEFPMLSNGKIDVISLKKDMTEKIKK